MRPRNFIAKSDGRGLGEFMGAAWIWKEWCETLFWDSKGKAVERTTALHDASRRRGPIELPPGLGVRQSSAALTTCTRTKTGETFWERTGWIHGCSLDLEGMAWNVVLRQQRQGGRGLPHSKTLCDDVARSSFRQVLECGNPLPLWPRAFERRRAKPFENGLGEFMGAAWIWKEWCETLFWDSKGKAVEDYRTPWRFATTWPDRASARSWSAAVLCRFDHAHSNEDGRNLLRTDWVNSWVQLGSGRNGVKRCFETAKARR